MEALKQLQQPFTADELLWRVQRSGMSEGEPWIRVVPYVHARTVQERLDDVLGIDGWQVKYRDGPGGHLICALGVRVGEGEGSWIWKEDGTGQLKSNDNFSSADAGKGDFSNAFKRAAASGYGIGRYLGYIPDDWAQLGPSGAYRSKVEGRWFRWDPPELPEWALPGGAGRPETLGSVNRETGELEEESVEALEGEVRKARNEALRSGNLTDEHAERVDDALASGEEERLRGCLDWLKGKVPSEDG